MCFFFLFWAVLWRKGVYIFSMRVFFFWKRNMVLWWSWWWWWWRRMCRGWDMWLWKFSTQWNWKFFPFCRRFFSASFYFFLLLQYMWYVYENVFLKFSFLVYALFGVFFKLWNFFDVKKIVFLLFSLRIDLYSLRSTVEIYCCDFIFMSLHLSPNWNFIWQICW